MYAEVKQCDNIDSYPLEQVESYCFDEYSSSLYIVSGQRIRKYKYSAKQLVLESENNYELPISQVLSFQYLMEIDSLVLVYKDGCMVKVTKNESENVGQFDCGVLAASWNPNQEQLIVVCSDGKMISFDIQLDPTNEILIADLVNEAASIAFKNDGKFFCLNHAIPGGRICQTYDCNLQVFQSPSKSDPDGGLVQAMFEKPRNLENCVAWQPNVGYIAGVEKDQTIFWEKNGLRHLEFKSQNVKNLKWSPDGNILAQSSGTHISLHLRSNFRWYQKKKIEGEIIGFEFLERQEFESLVVFMKNAMVMFWLRYECVDGLVSDNANLLITNFNEVIIPPPMSQYQVQVSDQIQLTYVNRLLYVFTCSKQMYIFDQNKLIANVDCTLIHGWVHKMIIIDTLYQQDDLLFGNFIFIVHDQTDGIVELLINKSFEIEQVWKKSFSLPTQISCICLSQQKQIIMHSRFGERFIYNLYKEENALQEFELAQSDKAFDIKIQVNGQWQVNLKSNKKLILNHQILSNECTSFKFYNHFLAFTANTTDLFHLLYIVDLNKQPIVIDTKALNASNIERGSKIVSIPRLDRLIIQVPRGNLETLAPRVMVLQLAKQLFDKQQYKQCYELIRRHKLDMNLLFDFNPQQFINDSQLIIEQLNENYLQILIQSIKNEVSFELPYTITNEQYNVILHYIKEKTIGTTKINLICDNLIKAMDENTHILTIVTAMLRKEPSEVEQALQKVMIIKQNELEDDTDLPPHLNPETNKPFKKQHKSIKSNQVLEYICWLADANKMFEVALGTYDFELVKQVAQFTQKDPKEFLPQLEKYQAIQDPIEMQSKIQIDLKNYDKAIQVLAQGSEKHQQQSLELAKKYERFVIAIESYKGTPMLNKVKELLGDYLITQKQHHQASLAYESAGLFDKAMQSSLELMDTKRVLSFKPKQEQLTELLDHAAQAGKWKDCGMIHEYLGDLKQAIHFYCKAEEWKKVAKCLRNETMDVSEELKLSYNLKVNLLLKQQTTFLTKYERLQVVQNTKKERGILAPSQLQADFDSVSDVSHKSGASKTSYTMSITTGVRKKKQQKEKSFLNRNIKEGSPVEEEYLIEYLKNIQSEATGIIKQIKVFQNYLIFFNQPQLSKQLSTKVKEYIKTINKPILSLVQLQFEEQHPEVSEIYNMKQQQFEFQQALDNIIK